MQCNERSRCFFFVIERERRHSFSFYFTMIIRSDPVTYTTSLLRWHGTTPFFCAFVQLYLIERYWLALSIALMPLLRTIATLYCIITLKEPFLYNAFNDCLMHSWIYSRYIATVLLLSLLLTGKLLLVATSCSSC